MAIGLALAGCNRDGRDSNRTVLNIRSQGLPPDEFLVLPSKPLERPADLTNLPTPTPGGSNLTDPDITTPLLTALGSRGTRGGIPAADAPLVRAVGGSTENIRGILAAEDAAFREDNAGRIESRASRLRAGSIYNSMTLDPVAEAERLRALGVNVPLIPRQ